jgi:hypothetical protein
VDRECEPRRLNNAKESRFKFRRVETEILEGDCHYCQKLLEWSRSGKLGKHLDLV